MEIARKLFAAFFIGSGIAFVAIALRLVVLVIWEHPAKSEPFLIAISMVLTFLGYLCCQRGFALWKGLRL
ncbi:hypothetical protein V2H45_10235 [Tumidithrix elongata RA019]|uniref:Uncharacterized protein n=1 Tax=Tumidithrix elongata BACA0141 TaxID=2716417 RepID=A0AAW9PXJ3_9CYAN|nr:hypothetical protein [Tumidithrix elongata RA019]